MADTPERNSDTQAVINAQEEVRKAKELQQMHEDAGNSSQAHMQWGLGHQLRRYEQGGRDMLRRTGRGGSTSSSGQTVRDSDLSQPSQNAGQEGQQEGQEGPLDYLSRKHLFRLPQGLHHGHHMENLEERFRQLGHSKSEEKKEGTTGT